MPRNSTPSRSPSTQKSTPKINLPSTQPINSRSPINYPQHYQSQPTMFQSVIQGFGLGMGSSIARNIFETKQPIVVNQPNPQPIYSSSISQSPITCHEYIKCLKKDDYSRNDCLLNLERTEYNNCEKMYK
jgi:hypothetical protein